MVKLIKCTNPICNKNINSLEKQNAKLRRALKRLLKVEPTYCIDDGWHGSVRDLVKARLYAEKALKEKE